GFDFAVQGQGLQHASAALSIHIREDLQVKLKDVSDKKIDV
ncbi:unnamed protein product, partial [Urochloa humidicola]